MADAVPALQLKIAPSLWLFRHFRALNSVVHGLPKGVAEKVDILMLLMIVSIFARERGCRMKETALVDVVASVGNYGCSRVTRTETLSEFSVSVW